MVNFREPDPLKEITRSMMYSIPNLGDNVVKHAKLVRVCRTRGCYRAVFVSEIRTRTGAIVFSCPEHGTRNRNNMMWLDSDGSTMIEFRKVGF